MAFGKNETELSAVEAKRRTFWMTNTGYRYFIRVDAEIVANASAVFRKIQIGEKQLDVIGLCDVATLPTYRGNGLATRLVRKKF